MDKDIYLLINEKTFEIYQGDMATNDLLQVRKGKSLKDALRLAGEYEEELLDKGHCLEYGFFFIEKLRGYEIINKEE